MKTNVIIHGDCLEVMRGMDSNSVDTVITDPPYGLSFMGKKWDYDVPAIEVWRECLRVLKHGGTLLCFAGSRTQHRMACNVEDAGFILKDCIMYLYGSGFPKATDISKQLDKTKDTKFSGSFTRRAGPTGNKKCDKCGKWLQSGSPCQCPRPQDKPVTPEAILWNGWKSHGLKPAYEPILVAMKPNDGTYANNALKHGVSGLNIDGGRIGDFNNNQASGMNRFNDYRHGKGKYPTGATVPHTQGRFPSNVILDEEAGAMLDEQSGVSKSSPRTTCDRRTNSNHEYGFKSDAYSPHNDKGGASRFFYCAKSSKKERNKGLDNTCTVKYNIPKDKIRKGLLCKYVVTVAVQLLKRVTSGLTIRWLIGESGENITAQCPQGSSSTISTEIKRIIESKTLHLLIRSLTNESIADANYETVAGGNLAESVGILSKWLLTITNGNQELALGASGVASLMLLQTSVSENWQPLTNIHSTVKPLALMEYLCTLTKTPTGGIVLDPFNGSGTTGVACVKTGRDYIGIEREQEYCEIARKRVQEAKDSMGLFA